MNAEDLIQREDPGASSWTPSRKLRVLMLVGAGAHAVTILVGEFWFGLEQNRVFVDDELAFPWIRAGWWHLVWYGVLVAANEGAGRYYPKLMPALIILFFTGVGFAHAHFMILAGFLSNLLVLLFLLDVVIAYLLFGFGYATFATLYGAVMLILISVLSVAGVLPYAPVLADKNARYYLTPPVTIFHVALFLAFIAGVWWLVRLVDRRSRELSAAYLNLREARAGLIRAEALASIGSLVTGAAHELRNPLGATGSLLSNLSVDITDSPTLAEAEKKDLLGLIDMVIKGEKRLAAIVERLYGLSDDLAETGESASLESVIQIIRDRHPEIVFQVAAEASSVWVNQLQALTIFSNILDNALQSGSAVPVELSAGIEGPNCVVRISDRGRGIPADIQRDLFRPFRTGERAGEGHGVGLGLYIVHELCRRLNWTILVDSAAGRGTTVSVQFPGERRSRQP